MPSWPADLPQRPQYPFGWAPQPNTREFQPEIGDAKVRRVGSATGAQASALFRLTADELAIFESWFAEDVADGSLPFEWVDPVTSRLAWWRIVGAYKVSVAVRGLHDVEFQLRRLP